MYEERQENSERNWKAIILRVTLVVVILILLWLLLPINNRNRNTDLSETFQNNMAALRDAGRNHFNERDLPTEQGSSIQVSLAELIRIGEVRELRDDNGNLCDESASFIRAVRTATDYQLEVNLICGREELSENLFLANIQPPGGNGGNTTTAATTTRPPQTTARPQTTRPVGTTRPSTTRPPSSQTTTRPTTTTTQQRFTVIFNSNCGSSVAAQHVVNGNTVTRPSNPTRAGFVFDGWFVANNQSFNFNTPIRSNIILIARWTIAGTTPSNQIFTVRFDTTGGSVVMSRNVQSGNTVNRPIDPTRAGFVFAGWYHNSTRFNFNTPIRTNLTLTARWTPLTVTPQAFTVTFNTGTGGSFVPSRTVQSGNTVPRPVNPTRAGFVFAGWDRNSASFNFNTAITSNVTLTARWTPVPINPPQTVTVNFDTRGGSFISPRQVQVGGTLSPVNNPTKQNAVFLGWFHNNQPFNMNTRINNNITLVARWRVTETISVDVFSAGWGRETNTFNVTHTLAIPPALRGNNAINPRLRSVEFVRPLTHQNDWATYWQRHNDYFQSTPSPFDCVNCTVQNLATINSATVVRTQPNNSNSREVRWSGNVSRQCTTRFNFSGVTNACVYGIVYRAVWEFEIER